MWHVGSIICYERYAGEIRVELSGNDLHLIEFTERMLGCSLELKWAKRIFFFAKLARELFEVFQLLVLI